MKKALLLLLTLCLLLQSVTGIAFAETGGGSSGDPAVDGNKTVNPVSGSTVGCQTEVTLSLPASETKTKYDIVFVVDGSGSMRDIFSQKVVDVLDELTGKNAEIRVAVVKYTGATFDALGSNPLNKTKDPATLVTYSSETKSKIVNALKYNMMLPVFAGGTNQHGGLRIAEKTLAADTEVPDSHKFIISVTDGATFIWNDANDDPTCYYVQWYDHTSSSVSSRGIKNDGVPSLANNTGRDMATYPYFAKDITNITFQKKTFWTDDYATLHASQHPYLLGASPFDETCYYADMRKAPSGKVIKHEVTNGTAVTNASNAGAGRAAGYAYWYEFIPDSAYKDLVWMEANPYEVINNGDGTYTFDTSKPNPKFYQIMPNTMQKGLFMAGHLWQDLDKKYTTATVILKDDSAISGSGKSTIISYRKWLLSNSDLSCYESSDDDVSGILDSIKEDIIYMIEKGKVTDRIGEKFDLVVTGTDTFRLTVGGSALACTELGTNMWGFGTKQDGVYPYIVTYNPATESFEWTINVPVEISKPVRLSYTLKLDEDAEPGVYPTNISAVLEYESTDGKTGEYVFPSPEFEYNPPVPVPKTGDEMPIALLGLLCLCAGAGLWMSIRRKRA